MSVSLVFDFNNLAIRCFFTKEVGGYTSENPEWNLWKYFTFNSIYESIQYHKNVKEIILAVDGKDSWRKLIYNRYKEDRVLKRKDDNVDWDKFYEEFNNLLFNISQKLPLKVIKVNRCEADDVIAILSKTIKNKVVIISNDSDYTQLCDGKKVKVYNPSKQTYMQLSESKEEFLTKLFLTGQKKDNIFNCITPSDYPNEVRKPGLGEKTAIKILNNGLDEYLNKKQKLKKKYKNSEGEEVIYESEFLPLDNFNRNKKLIDFNSIPPVIEETINLVYNRYEKPEPDKMFTFFKEYGWTGYLEDYVNVESTLLNLY